jgi:hypothetical protein
MPPNVNRLVGFVCVEVEEPGLGEVSFPISASRLVKTHVWFCSDAVHGGCCCSAWVPLRTLAALLLYASCCCKEAFCMANDTLDLFVFEQSNAE